MHRRSYQSSPATPAGPSASNSTRHSKLEHIIQNFYTKVAQVIVQARLAPGLDSYGNRKLNKWFNIATEDVDLLREDLKYWRTLAINSIDEEPPPMIIEIYLDTSKLTQNHALVVTDDNMRQNPVHLGPNDAGLNGGVERILLESWTLTLKCLRKFNDLNGLSIEHRFASTVVRHNDEIPIEVYEFSDVVTPLGTFKLHVRFRRNCNFQLEDCERDLSARFIDMDEHYFTPTMAKYRQEQDPQPQQKRRPYSMYESETELAKETESEDVELEDFMRFVRSSQELKLFQGRASTNQLAESTNLSTPSEASSIMGGSALVGGSIYRSKKALSHFQNLRETHASLSESMSSSMMVGGTHDRNETPSSAIGISPGSSSSSAGRSYQPVVPSPLHAEQNTASPVYIPRPETQTVSVSSTESRHHRRHRSSQQGITEESRGSDFRVSPEMGAFSSYPQDRHHIDLRRLCLPEDAQDEDEDEDEEERRQHNHEVKVSTMPSARHGSGYPCSQSLGEGNRRSLHEASAAGIGSGIQGGRASVVDDDDSLVFKMSELGGESSLQQADNAPSQGDTAMLFNRPFSIETFNNTVEYAKRLRPQGRPISGLRRISSSSNIPQQINEAAISADGEPKSPSDSAGSSKSEPFIKPETYQVP
ncbi:autophagy protein 13 [Apophysomyces sp. BC1034]|nr:autophagy protein 13 [Apophysomyces sp. BC1034]